MPTNPAIFIVGTIIAVLLVAIFIIVRKYERKVEIRVRRERFNRIREGKEDQHPNEAILWLAYRLFGLKAYDSTSSRHYEITESDLGISSNDCRQVIITLLGIWWNKLEVAQPTIFNTLNPIYYFNDKFCEIRMLMDTLMIGESALEKDSSLLISDCVQNCCAMLENTLQFYSDAPGTKPSVGELHEALLEYWINPSRELQDKWQKWVKAAYLRQAKHILVRLRGGQYLFPETNTQVDNLLAYLTCAKADPKAIGTWLAELKRLRGFMTSV